ncbi:phosphatase PAP2 family protein [Mucilaginibacter pallidiroseus]|uniref:Phosphatase PAP2 family protein n=1 Tax=Mucilaginibacter pallidiroseus TaxID=2599295 RepID=A0A563U7V8_9SPHI|nr:phosphatase PAP2 family protein [Mucilaginibacter pallidiroseus]TWR27430.1 phosphatase PAP2 family protein [Mucilaginibacter pallidiroseus]
MNNGARDVFYRTRYFLLPYIIVLCGCLVIKFLYSRETIYFTVNSHYSDLADIVMPYITYAGDGITVLLIAAALAILKSYRSGFLLASSYGVSSLVAQVLKYAFDMPRPGLYFQDQLSKIHLVKDLYILKVHSFPSGHTVTAFSAGIALTYLIQEKMWGLVLFAVAVLIGYSRMYLSQHFFEDVMAGSVVGAITTVLWIAFIDRKAFINSPLWCRGLLKK